jgi:8-oxo-dGTP pyrophosphatase MutT (NUDIX family)
MPISMITTVPLRQAGYRFAYTALRCYWFLVRPRVAGRLCLLVHEHQLLLIRNTYGSRAWTFPGGMIKRGETPEVSTQREVREEGGITGVETHSLISAQHQRITPLLPREITPGMAAYRQWEMKASFLRYWWVGSPQSTRRTTSTALNT